MLSADEHKGSPCIRVGFTEERGDEVILVLGSQGQRIQAFIRRLGLGLFLIMDSIERHIGFKHSSRS